MEDEFEIYKARSYGRLQPNVESNQQQQQHFLPQQQRQSPYQQHKQQHHQHQQQHHQQHHQQQHHQHQQQQHQQHHNKTSKSKHPRRSRLKSAVTETTPSSSCEEKSAEESKKRRHSAMGVADLRQKCLPAFIPLEEEEGVRRDGGGVENGGREGFDEQRRRKSEQNSSKNFKDQDVMLNPQKHKLHHPNPTKKVFHQQLQRQQRLEESPGEEGLEEIKEKKIGGSRVNFRGDVTESRNTQGKKCVFFEVDKNESGKNYAVGSYGGGNGDGGNYGGGNGDGENYGGGKSKRNSGDKIKDDKGDRSVQKIEGNIEKERRLSCSNILSSNKHEIHQRRHSAKVKSVHQDSTTTARGGGHVGDFKGSENIEIKRRNTHFSINNTPNNNNKPLKTTSNNRQRRSSMFMVQEPLTPLHKLTPHKPSPNKQPIISPTTPRRNSRPNLSPPINAPLNSGRRNSAITYLPDFSPSRSKVSLNSSNQMNEGWKKEVLTSSPAEEDKERGDGSEEDGEDEEGEVMEVKVLVLGASGVGKTTLMCQLLTSEYLANKNGSDIDLATTKSSATVFLDGESCVVFFSEVASVDDDLLDDTDACVVTYAVNDHPSYLHAITYVEAIRTRFAKNVMFVTLAANKQDLVRNRVVSIKEGKKVCTDNGCKYVEVSALLDHKVDKLLADIIRGVKKRRNKLKLIASEAGNAAANDDVDDGDDEDDEDKEEDEKKDSSARHCVNSALRWLVKCFC